MYNTSLLSVRSFKRCDNEHKSMSLGSSCNYILLPDGTSFRIINRKKTQKMNNNRIISIQLIILMQCQRNKDMSHRPMINKFYMLLVSV